MKALEGALGRADTKSTMHSAVTTAGLPSPPITGLDVAHWNGLEGAQSQAGKTAPEFDVEYTGDGAIALSAARLLGGIPEAFAPSNDDVDTVDFADNELDLAAHVYASGDGPFQLTTTDTLPAGLLELTDYWVIYVAAGSIKLALTREDALNGTFVSFTDAGTGTHTVVAEASCESFTWLSHGLVGDAGDGAVAVSATLEGFTQRHQHRPRVQAYAIAGTIDTNNLTVKAYVVQEV